MALSLRRYTRSDLGTRLHHILKERIEKERERSPVLEIKIGDDLPQNVIFEILSWLPVKALLQFKSVCKSWYAIISSPDFISKHLRNYYKNKNGDNDCLLVQCYVSYVELESYELLLDDTPRVLADEVLCCMPMYDAHICGPCDGIYYLYNCDVDECVLHLHREVGRALWNPAINELKVLPPIIVKPDLPSGLTYARDEVCGFGYDPSTDDYKVVVVKGYWTTTPAEEESEVWPPLSVLIYSLRTDSWRYWGDLSRKYDLVYNICDIVVNGCFYWLQSCEQDENHHEVIISFNMVIDTIQEMRVPNYDQPASKSLGIYDDSLAFLAIHDNEKRLDIWTWKEGHWTKKFTMGPIPGDLCPIGHWKKNKILLQCEYSKLFLCDTDTQEIKDLAFQRNDWCGGLLVYRESLLSVKDKSKWGHHELAETDADQV